MSVLKNGKTMRVEYWVGLGQGEHVDGGAHDEPDRDLAAELAPRR